MKSGLTRERVLDSAIRNPQSAIRILINAGPTREYFDTVRFISNASTGKQGFAIARAAVDRGHRVVLVAGVVNLPDVAGAKMIHVTTAAEMAEACKQEFPQCDAAILTAAVCDYRPSAKLPYKLKKSDQGLHSTFEPTEDICAALGGIKQDRILIGFAMDDRDGKANAEAKLVRKNCDIIVQNGPENVGADCATVSILHACDGWCEPISEAKEVVAVHLISMLESAIMGRRVRSPQKAPADRAAND